MFSSTIIPTIGRSTLSRAVNSVLNQTSVGDRFEVIVVNDSGNPLRQAEWQESEHVQVISTNKRERSVARNTGAAIAKGDYLHFLDDDDWLAPEALRNLWELTQNADAGWFYGSTQLVNRQGKSVLQLNHGLNGNCFIQVLAGEWIPLQASLIAAEKFFGVGGFNPLISGPEDVDLLRRIALHCDIAGTSSVVANIEWGHDGSSTNYDRHAEFSRFARESILDERSSFSRMRSSAITSYWHGRVVRAYLTSTLWNIKHNRPMRAASRAIFALTGLITVGTRSFHGDFWRAVAYKYESKTFARGLMEADQAVAGKAGNEYTLRDSPVK